MRTRILYLGSLIALLSLLAGACAPAAPVPTRAPVAPAAPAVAPAPPTAPPAATIAPAPTATAKPQTLTIYSGRTEELVKPIIDQFSSATGIKVQVRYGDTAALAATLLEEGKNSPADAFFAQDPGGLGAVAPLLAKLPDDILNRVEPRFRSPEGKWVGVSGRARTVVYNTTKLNESDLPDDVWDFTDAKWKGRIGWAPTNGSFQAMVTTMQVLWGQEKAGQWLKGIRANNPKEYKNNTGIVQAVGAGEVEVGFVNHYYLFRFLQEQGEAFPVRNYHPRAGGPGAVILVAGSGVLESSRNKEAAQRFLDYVLSPVAQQYFAGQTFEYPVVQGVKVHRELVPLADIKSPEMDLTRMADLKGTLTLLREMEVVP